MENKNNSTKSININDAPKALKVFLWLLPLVLFLLFIESSLDNDFYFLYPTGEYIVNNGFPVKDFLSWHGNMDIVVQQWLSTVIFYQVYHSFGIIGTTLLQCVCVVILYSLFYKLLKVISDNYTVSLAFSALFTFFIAIAFVKTRPQIFTYIIIVAELLVLEQFVKTKKTPYLIILPLLSLLLVNLHSAMWMMQFVLMLPYFAQSVPINIGKLKQTSCASFVKLLVAALASVCVGFLNPYGIKAMLYIFTSYGLSSINAYINEMQPITFAMSEGKFLFALILVLTLLFVKFKKGRFELRFVLLSLGTLVLSLSSGKSLPYFYICAGMLCASYFKSFSYTVKIDKNEGESKERVNWKKIVVIFAVLIVACAGAFALGVNDGENITNNENNEAVNSVTLEEDLDPIIDYIKAQNPDDMVLFNSFNSGPYLEYNGIKTFIDARAELYFKKNNHEADYFENLFEYENGTMYYKDFIEKYGFNYLVIQNKKYVVYNPLINDTDYEEVICGENYSLFVKK